MMESLTNLLKKPTLDSLDNGIYKGLEVLLKQS